MTFAAKDPERRGELGQAVVGPLSSPELHAKRDIDFERWRNLPSELLSLESNVSEYVVEPLASILADTPLTQLPDPYRLEQEHRLPGGSVDFVFRWGKLPPVAAVEVKLAIQRPGPGIWMDSPDFRQLRLHMEALEVPGLLIDRHSLILVAHGADAPYAEIVRSEATWDDVILICDLLNQGFQSKRDWAPKGTRRVRRRG